MTSATASRRRQWIVILFLAITGVSVAAIGTAPLVFLIWMLRGIPHWLDF